MKSERKVKHIPGQCSYFMPTENIRKPLKNKLRALARNVLINISSTH